MDSKASVQTSAVSEVWCLVCGKVSGFKRMQGRLPPRSEKELAMFQHILIPTDGSELSNLAVTGGVKFAKETHAKITGLTVTRPYHLLAIDALQASVPIEEYSSECDTQAKRNLSTLKEAAYQAGVTCELVHRSSEHPYEEIVKTAQDKQCDVIFLASHGRRGVGALILGSETQKVLTHTKIPVLVYR
jgi:nucleotide-binding universal stress UspA family protein